MKQAVASAARPVRRRQPGAVSRAKTTAGRMRTPPISRTVAVAPSTSAPAATGHRPCCCRPRRPGPQQQHQAGRDHGLEQHVRHDGLLELELIRVEQHRRRGERRGPSRHAAPDQQRVHGDRHGQAEGVLDRRDQGESAHRIEQPQQDLVTLGRGAARTDQVLGRVNVEQRRAVGDLGEHPQRQPGRQDQDERPVGADGCRHGLTLAGGRSRPRRGPRRPGSG